MRPGKCAVRRGCTLKIVFAFSPKGYWFEPLRYPVGTKLRVLGPPIHHEGTYVGPVGANGEDVIHCDKLEGMILSHFDEFADGGFRVETPYTPRSPDEGRQIVQRALDTLARRIPYNVVGINGWNCEQAANYHQRGQAVSPSVWLLVGLGVIVALASARNN